MAETVTWTLADIVREFETCGHEVESARGQCRDESFRFVLALEEVDIAACLIDGFLFSTMREILAEEGLTPEEIETHKDEMDLDHPMITNGHTAALVGDTVYDWTARQFWPHDQPVPLVQPVSEWRETWRRIQL